MNPKILRFFRNIFLTLVCIMASPVSAATTSYLLKIDPLTSSSNTSGGFAGFNQNFTLSGTFNAHVTDGITIQFENLDVVGTALDSPHNQYPPGTVVKFTDFPSFPGVITSTFPICLACPTSFSGSIVINNIQQSYTGAFDSMRPLMAMKGQVLPLSGADFFTTVYSLNAAVITPAPSPTPTPVPALSVGDVNIIMVRDITVAWRPLVTDLTMNPLAPTCRIVNPPAKGIATVDTYCLNGTYTPAPGYVGSDSFTYQASKGSFFSNLGTVSVTVTPQSIEVSPVAVSGTSGQIIAWKPQFSFYAVNPVPTCYIATPAQNGVASVMTDCSSGTYQSYPGFVGTDSFVYTVDACTGPVVPCYLASATVTVAVTEGTVDQICVQNNPLSQFSQTGKEGTITVSFTGNITSHTNKEVKVCPGTPLKYQTSSTQGPVVCKVKNNTSRGSGSLKINDHIKCTDKPAGKDKVHFKVKSGVK